MMSIIIVAVCGGGALDFALLVMLAWSLFKCREARLGIEDPSETKSHLKHAHASSRGEAVQGTGSKLVGSLVIRFIQNATPLK